MHEAQVRYFLDHLEEENTFHSLLEAGDGLIPRLKARFALERDPTHRTALVELIWQYRNPAVIPWLARVLDDPDDDVWQEALNGLVTFGAADMIRAALSDASPVKREWLEEALEQIV